MSDIVERLREKRGILDNKWPGPSVLELDAAAEIEQLRRRVVALEMLIGEEISASDCIDDANRMLVEDISERSSAAQPSHKVMETPHD